MRCRPKVKRAIGSKSICGLRSWAQKLKRKGQPAHTFYSIRRLCCVFTGYTLIYWIKVQKGALIITPTKAIVRPGTYAYINQLRRYACHLILTVERHFCIGVFIAYLWNCSLCMSWSALCHFGSSRSITCTLSVPGSITLLFLLALSVLTFNYISSACLF